MLEYALGAERDSILFYTEMKRAVSADDQNIIDEIVEEERRHFLKVATLEI